MAKRKIIPGNVLAEGEATGHAHRVNAPVYDADNGLKEFTGPATATHEEHGPITLPAKKLVSGRVQMFDYEAEEQRHVLD